MTKHYSIGMAVGPIEVPSQIRTRVRVSEQDIVNYSKNLANGDLEKIFSFLSWISQLQHCTWVCVEARNALEQPNYLYSSLFTLSKPQKLFVCANPGTTSPPLLYRFPRMERNKRHCFINIWKHERWRKEM